MTREHLFGSKNEMRCVLSESRNNAKDWGRQRKKKFQFYFTICMFCLKHSWNWTLKGSVVSATVKWGHFLQYISYHRCPGLCDIRLLKHAVCEAASQNQPKKLAQIPVATLGLQGFNALLNWNTGITSSKSYQSIPTLMNCINSISLALLAHLALIRHLDWYAWIR